MAPTSCAARAARGVEARERSERTSERGRALTLARGAAAAAAVAATALAGRVRFLRAARPPLQGEEAGSSGAGDAKRAAYEAWLKAERVRVLGGDGLGTYADEARERARRAGEGAAGAGALLTAEEVARHNTLDDAWVIVSGRVFDITDFAITHPGWKVRRSLCCVPAGRAGRARR